MTTYAELRGGAPVWPGAMDPALLAKRQVQASMYLADMAKRGNWRKVLRELDHRDRLVDVKQWRPGGTSWLTVLHHAAGNDAPLEVVAGLVERGALRSQPDARGRTAYDIAVEQGHSGLLEALAPPPSPLQPGQIAALDANLAATIDQLIQPLFAGRDLRALFRYPPVEVLHEVPGLWFPVPYLWGGFRVLLADGRVELLGGYRELDLAGATHVATAGFLVTVDGVTQVSESFD